MDDTWEDFAYKITKTAANTTRENLNIPSLPSQYEHVLEAVALENVTSATTSARLFVTNGVTEYFHRQWTTLTQAVLYYDNTLTLRCGAEEFPGVAFYGATVADVLTAYFRGKRRKVV